MNNHCILALQRHSGERRIAAAALTGIVRSHAAALLFLVLCLGDGVMAQAWAPQGPAPNTGGQVEGIANREVSGAIRAVAVHPIDPNVVYVGTVNGGIWKTETATAASPVWQVLTDDARSLSIGALAFDPTDNTHRTLLAGVGRFSSFRSGGGALTGLLLTTDGLKWNAIDDNGTLQNVNISGVAPRGDVIVVSTGDGIYRGSLGGTLARISGDGKSLLPAGESFDLAGDPIRPARLFTNAGSQGIYRSDDTGTKWDKVSNRTIDALLNNQTRNVRIAVGRHNNVYLAIANGDDETAHLVGLFRSGNGGNSWDPIDIPKSVEDGNFIFDLNPGGQADVHLSMVADPDDPNVVYVGGDRQPARNEGRDPNSAGTWPNSLGAKQYSGRLFRIDATKPKGTQAVSLTHSHTKSNSAPHPDSRSMMFAANGVLIEVDDGGIYRRTSPRRDDGDWFSMNGNLQIAELHSIVWDAVSRIMVAGAQDTGVLEQFQTAGQRWRTVITGDGGYVLVDDKSTAGFSNRYSSAQHLIDFRRLQYDSSNRLRRQTSIPLRVIAPGEELETQFYTPVELNAVRPQRLVVGAANGVYESPDQGSTVTEIAPGLRVNESGPLAYGATDNPDILYLGSGSSVFVRATANSRPSQSASYLGMEEVLGITLDPENSKRAFAIDPVDVYLTEDAGQKWEMITGNLAALKPVMLRSVVFCRINGMGAIVLGTNNGVFIAPGPKYSNWTRLGTGLPAVPVLRLKHGARDGIIVAATLGRGAWRLNLPDKITP